MLIHTLGPEETDSATAAQSYLAHHPGQLQLHTSFEELLRRLRNFAGDYLLLPTAFHGNQTLPLSWGQVHYRYLDQLELKEAFVTELDEMVILENIARPTGLAYSHPATADLLAQTVKAEIQFSPSKYQAYQAYQKNGRYVLTSRKLVDLRPSERILKRFQVKMIWSLYLIKER